MVVLLLSLGLWGAIWVATSSLFFRLDADQPGVRRSTMKAGYIDESSNWAGSEEVSAAHYHAAAARARKLHAEATTPRLKQYLRELITRFEGLARGFQTESGTS
jgi:hypothetical protein